MRIRLFRRKPRPVALRPADVAYIDPVGAAQVVEPAPGAMWGVYLLLGFLVAAVAWASMATVDIIAKATARVVPEGRDQIIASLEGGILRELLVREGEPVQPGQPLALLDPTRVGSAQAEGVMRRMALLGTLSRLQAEAAGGTPVWPPELPAAVVQGETENHQARHRVLTEAVETNRRSMGLLTRELQVAEGMAAKGLMSEVEVMRLRRQVNDLNQQTQERINRFRQEASGELVRVRNELALLDEQMVVRDDALRRSTLVSPVRGLVKQIRANTVGGVVAPGAPVMEIVPLGERVLVEARVTPRDIGFVQVGQPVEVKLSAYEYTVYGALKGTVVSLSPDALGDPDRPNQPDATWYRALVRTETSTLRAGNRELTVLPGMTGMVEIRTGQRTVLGFLLRPMLRSQEAFRER